MQSAEDFIAELFHIREDYDPRKRREYYLRTRKLKGRRVGSSRTAIARHPVSKAAPVVKPLRAEPKKTAEQRRKETEARVAALQARLDTLRKVLADLVAQAKLRSGVESSPTQAPQKQQPQTAQQRRDAAERSQDYYEKNKEQILSDKEKTLQDQIQRVEQRIREMRVELQKVRARVVKSTPLERGTRPPRKADPVGGGTRIPPRKETSRGER